MSATTKVASFLYANTSILDRAVAKQLASVIVRQVESELQSPAMGGDAMDRLDAAWLAGLFTDGVIYDLAGAADYLGIAKNSIERSVARGRISCVVLANKKLFTRADLDAYKLNLGHGKYGKPIGAHIYHIGREGEE